MGYRRALETGIVVCVAILTTMSARADEGGKKAPPRVSLERDGVFIAFRDAVTVDPASLLIGGNPRLGADPAALQLTREVRGVGNVLVPVRVEVKRNVIVLRPLEEMADGHYTLGIFKRARSSGGAELVRAPWFHAFEIDRSPRSRLVRIKKLLDEIDALEKEAAALRRQVRKLLESGD